MNYQLFGHVVVGISVAVVSFYVHKAYSHGDYDSRTTWSEGHVCYVDYGKEPNYYDKECKSYYSCNDYWGALHYCPNGYQFHFDYKDCLKDDQVLCQWQLEHYANSGPSPGQADSGSSPDYERTCHIDFGIEPNYNDYDCKSYYNCKNYWGSLYFCPSGYQFHFKSLACEKDEDVLCKWQLEQQGSSGASSSGSGSFSGSSGSSSTSARLLTSQSYHSRDSSEGHICHVANGYEPNYDDSEECASYWSCEDYWGTLQYCHGSDQFHFQYKMCMNDDDVSCWVQMEKYYHGHSYASEEQSSDSSSRSKTCEMSQGQEPNYYDEGCKSYWYCEDHYGTLHECPTGFQFDWNKLDCVRDEEVICEKQMEYYYEHMYYNQVHSEDDPYHGGDHNGETESDYYSGSLNSNGRRHRCDLEHGRQADYYSKKCDTYWLCSGYHGTLERCPRGYQFHWHQRECLKDEYVECRKQRDSFPHFEIGVH